MQHFMLTSQASSNIAILIDEICSNDPEITFWHIRPSPSNAGPVCPSWPSSFKFFIYKNHSNISDIEDYASSVDELVQKLLISKPRIIYISNVDVNFKFTEARFILLRYRFKHDLDWDPIVLFGTYLIHAQKNNCFLHDMFCGIPILY